MKPPICNNKNVGIVGIKKTIEYAKLLFGDINNFVSKKEKECILNSDLLISQNIRMCVEDLTINNSTKPNKVAKGLALNSNNTWVSACAEKMPCIEFNKYVKNGTFTELIKSCHAEEQFKKLFNNTHFIECSWYGVEYCQNLNPEKCLYLERDSCSNVDYLYGCAVSRWVYASNFMLLYILDPNIAAKMPGCRIIY
tara:strand:+ start:739 stop:1326 length:588 start_codon:yes stop_codon:yes gene_type:complete